MPTFSRLLAVAAVLATVASGMPPCKRCGAARLHSRDDLLAMDDGELNEMKDKLEKEVPELEEELEAQKAKHATETGTLGKRLDGINAAYKKLSEDSIKRTAKFSTAKAEAAKTLDDSIDGVAAANGEISDLHAALGQMHGMLDPFVDRLISGEGWPKGCKCDKAKAVLQQLKVALLNAGARRLDAATLLSSKRAVSAGALTPEEMAKYKLVRAVMQLEEKRAKLMTEKTEDMTSYSTQQRIMLDRIDAANVKSQLKARTEQKYEASDKELATKLDSQVAAAGRYRDSAQGKLDRLKKYKKEAMGLGLDFMKELKKCNCLHP